MKVGEAGLEHDRMGLVTVVVLLPQDNWDPAPEVEETAPGGLQYRKEGIGLQVLCISDQRMDQSRKTVRVKTDTVTWPRKL